MRGRGGSRVRTLAHARTLIRSKSDTNPKSCTLMHSMAGRLWAPGAGRGRHEVPGGLLGA